MLEPLLDGSDDLCGQWLAFLTLEDLKTLSSVSSSGRFTALRRLVTERAVWRLPYPSQWRVGSVTPVAEDAPFDYDAYETTTYLGSMDTLMRHSIRMVSVARGVLLGYVAARLPNVRSVRTWQFKGEVAGINELSVVKRRRLHEQLRTIDLLQTTGSAAWKELSLRQVQVAGVHRLAALTELESMEIEQSDIADGISEFQVLAPLTQLKALSLKCARFDDFTGLDAFAQLTSLSIAGVTISSLEGIDGAPALTKLDLHNVWVENAVIPLSGLTRLRHLRAEVLGASDPLDVQLNAPDLESCSFRYCWLLHHDFLAGSTKLKDLDLRGTVRGAESRIPQLPSLQRLYISSNPAAARAFDWSASPQLESLHLTSWNPASPDSVKTNGSFLASLPNLKTLEIDKLSQFEGIPKRSLAVTSLSLHHVESTDEFVLSELLHDNARLQVFHLQAASVTALRLRALPHPEDLLELHLVNISIDNLDVFQYFTRLRRLSVSGMSYKQSFRSLQFLRGLPSLKSLTVTRNPDFHDISVLASLAKLEYLNLKHTRVSDVSSLAKLTTLQELELGHTLVKSVADLHSLKHIRRVTLPRDVDCAVFGDSKAFPLLRSIVHEDELDCCTMGHGPVAPW